MKYIPYLFILLSLQLNAAEFPQSPDPELTPGELCRSPERRRYAEQINYCRRDVSRELKSDIFSEYRKRRGFTLTPSKRHQYKIDHLIPLCAGGSNSRENLWPQHQSIYIKTDPIEQLGCEKLAQNKIRQKKLIELIFEAKNDLSKADRVMKEIKAL